MNTLSINDQLNIIVTYLQDNGVNILNIDICGNCVYAYISGLTSPVIYCTAESILQLR